MDKKQVEWIWEYVLKHSSNYRIITCLVQAFPIPVDNVRIKKMVLLKTLSFEFSKGLISDLCIELLQGLDELSKVEQQIRDECLEQERSLEVMQEKRLGILGQEVMKENEKGKIRVLRRELDLALKVELTVQHLRDGDKGWPSFVEALDKYWGDFAQSEEGRDQDDEITSAQKQVKLELWAIKARPKLQNEVIFKYSQDAVEKKLKAFLDFAWEEIGLTFLEKVGEDVLKGVYRPAGGVELLQGTSNQLQKDDAPSKEKVNKEKTYINTSIPVSGVEAFSRDDNLAQVEATGLQDKILHETILVEDDRGQAFTRQKGNNRVQTRSHSRCLREPPPKKRKGKVATSLQDSSTRKRLSQDSFKDGKMENGFRVDRQDEEYEVRPKLNHTGKSGNEPKDGETTRDLKDSRSIQEDEQEDEAVQREGMDQQAQDIVAFHGIGDRYQRIQEVREDPTQQFHATFLVKRGNKSKDISGKNKNLLSSSEVDDDSLHGDGGVGEEAQAKGPSSMGGSLEKHHLSHRGTTDVEHFVASGTEKDQSLDNLEISKAQQELEDSQSQFQSCVNDPLPAAIKIAEEAKTSMEKDAYLSPGSVATRKAARLQEKKAVSFLYVWETEDEIEDDQTESSPSDSKKVHLPELRARKVSPLKPSASSPNQAYRRKRRKWSRLEEETLRTGVIRHGKGRWKLILQEHVDIFQDRTEVDLKDKWRNIEKSEGLSEDD